MEKTPNYQKMLDSRIEELKAEEKIPSLLLHSCCAPCSSYVLEYLSSYFHITLFYYNPNISPEGEYRHRVEELKRLVASMPAKYPVSVLEGPYEPEVFEQKAKGLEEVPEGGSRCFRCYEMRLRKTAELACEKKFDFFTTTLSISPMKNARWLNEIGKELSEEFGTEYLYSDFKKKNGYKRSIELSHQYDLYRQDFCGCIYSSRQREKQKEEMRQREILREKTE